MKAVVEVAIYPIGTGSTSFSQQCKQCVQVFKQRGLKHSVHATGTDVEGELDDIMMAVQEAQQQLHASGIPRLSTVMAINTVAGNEGLTMDRELTAMKEE